TSFGDANDGTIFGAFCRAEEIQLGHGGDFRRCGAATSGAWRVWRDFLSRFAANAGDRDSHGPGSGATPSGFVGGAAGAEFCGWGLSLAGVGAAAGVVTAWFLTRWMKSLLFGVSATDLATYVWTIAVLLVVAVGASLLPGVRATKVDPVIALRYE